MTSIADKLREAHRIADRVLDALDKHGSFYSDQHWRELKEVLPDPQDVADKTETVSLNDFEKVEQQRDELAAVIRRAREVGFNEDCIFCGFKDRELRRAPR